MPIDASIYSALNTSVPLQLSQLLMKQNDPMVNYQKMLQIKKMQQEMDAYPEDQQMRALERKAKIGELEAHAQERSLKTSASAREQALFNTLRTATPDSPEYKQAWTEMQLIKAPATAFEKPEAQKLPWYVSRDATGKATIDPAYADFEAMKASKGGTKINTPAPVTPVTIQDPNNPNGTIVIDGRTRQVLGAGPKLSQIGSASQKLGANLPQAKLITESIKQNLGRLYTAMSTLHDDPNLSRITGTVAGRTWNLTNEATGAQTDLDSIKSQIFQTSLQAMREASKTGGAVGNVSDKEGDKLERTIAGLDQSAGTPKFKENLKKAMDQVATSMQLIQNAFDEEYGNVESFPTNSAAKTRSGATVSNW